MLDYVFSEHAYDMLRERNIQESWVRSAIEEPDKKETMPDGAIHYVKCIEEFEGRYLRVIVNPNVEPEKIVTLLFNRRPKRSV